MREQVPCMVPIHASSTSTAWSGLPISRRAALMRERSSAAAFSVKVMAMTCSMLSTIGPSCPSSWCTSKAFATRSRKVNVLPDPAPAMTAMDLSKVFAQATCPPFKSEKLIPTSPRTRQRGNARTRLCCAAFSRRSPPRCARPPACVPCPPRRTAAPSGSCSRRRA